MSGVWLVGRQACGCITRVDCEPDDMDAKERRSWGQFVAEGGEALRMSDDEGREALKGMAFACPHDPIGWGPSKGEPNPNRQTSLIEEGRNDG